jgi:hypothetical protein
MMGIVVVVALTALGTHAQATAPRATSISAASVEEFRRIAAAHHDLRAYHLEIEAVVETGSLSIPIRATVKCDLQKRCLRIFLSSITLETPEVSLMVNGVERTITFTKHEQGERVRSDVLDPSSSLETWLQRGGAVSGGEITTAGQHWVMAPEEPTLPTIEMYVDLDTHLLRRLTYETAAAGKARGRVDIAYSWRDPAGLDPGQFEIGQFVLEDSGTWKPAAAYANYRIITSNPQ